MAKISIEYEINGCKDCPYLTCGQSFGNDGRDGRTVYLCKKGVFGKSSSYGGYYDGENNIPNAPPYGCPIIKSNAIDRLASKLNISTQQLIKILDEANCIVDEK